MWHRNLDEIAAQVRRHEFAGDTVSEFEVDDLRALLDAIPTAQAWSQLEEWISDARLGLKRSKSQAAVMADDSLREALKLLRKMRRKGAIGGANLESRERPRVWG